MRIKNFISTLLSVVLGLILFVLLLAVSNTNVFSFDLSSDRRFTLTPQARKAFTSLPGTVCIYAFVTDPKEEELAKRLRRRILRAFPETVSFRLVEPFKNPELAKQFDFHSRSGIVVHLADNPKRFERTGLIAEQPLTAALMRLSRPTTEVFVLKGHGERDLGESVEGLSAFSADLLLQGFDLKPRVIDELGLTGCKTLLIAGPTEKMTEREQRAVESLLERGGQLLLLLERDTPAQYAELVKSFAIEAPEKALFDMSSNAAGLSSTAIESLNYNVVNPICYGLEGPVLFQMARPIAKAPRPLPNVTASELLWTGPAVFALEFKSLVNNREVDISKLPHTSYPLASCATKGSARVVVIGDCDVACNGAFNLGPHNRYFLRNVMSWLAEGDERLIKDAPEEPPPPVKFTQSDWRIFSAFSLLIPPILMAGLGVLAVAYRRS